MQTLLLAPGASGKRNSGHRLAPTVTSETYFLWGVMNRKVNGPRHADTSTLQASIREDMATLDKSLVKKACDHFSLYLEVVITAGGGYFE